MLSGLITVPAWDGNTRSSAMLALPTNIAASRRESRKSISEDLSCFERSTRRDLSLFGS